MTPEFRAWDKKNEIYLYNVQDAYDTLSGFVKYDDGKNATYDESCFGDFLDNKRYDTEQFTGLKDVNGNKIFEGDIVHVSVELNSEISGYAEVVFESGSFVIKGEIMKQILFDGILYDSYSDWDDRLSLYDCACVVVGNVHENLELMEVDK